MTQQDYNAVTAGDIAEFLHHLAELRVGARSHDPAEPAAFLTRKAELFTQIANAHTRTDPDYCQQLRQMSTDARAAAERACPQATAPQQPVGPNHRRTTARPPDPAGARSQEKTGASPG